MIETPEYNFTCNNKMQLDVLAQMLNEDAKEAGIPPFASVVSNITLTAEAPHNYRLVIEPAGTEEQKTSAAALLEKSRAFIEEKLSKANGRNTIARHRDTSKKREELTGDPSKDGFGR